MAGVPEETLRRISPGLIRLEELAEVLVEGVKPLHLD